MEVNRGQRQEEKGFEKHRCHAGLRR
jgi:hypothetical protein